MSRIEEPSSPGVSISITTASKPSSSPRWIASSRYSWVTGLTSFSNSATRTSAQCGPGRAENAAAAASAARAIRPRGGERSRHWKVYARPRFWKELSSAARRPTASAPVSTAASPRLETSTRGGYGSQRASSVADGPSRRSPFGADAAAEDDERDVGDGGDRRDVQRDPARLLVDDGARERVAGARGREDARARRTAAAASSRRRRAGEPRRERRDGGRARVDLVAAAGRDEVDLAGGAVAAAVELAPEHEPGAEAGADREEHEVVDPARDPAPVLADGGEVDVVLDVTGSPSRVASVVAEVAALEARDVRREPELAGRRRRRRRDADDRAVDQLARRARTIGERVAQRADRLERRVGVGAVELDVLARADLAAQVADRAAQEARAEVEAEDERRLRNGLEEDGAVARAGPGPASVSRTSPASSSDCSASETVGFEMPARREISAREIGAPSRIVSSTVRSFRSFSSGGIARRWHRVRHLVKNLTRICRTIRANLTSSWPEFRVAFGKLTNLSHGRRGWRDGTR